MITNVKLALKTCTYKGCKQENPQPLDYFYKLKNGLQSHCKSCIKQRSKEWCAKNPEKRKRMIRDLYRADPIKAKGYQLKHEFGLSIEQYKLLLYIQDNKCAICKRNESEFTKKLSVDHDHSTNKIRGLLCGNCNRAIGLFKEDKEVISKAIDYLERHK